MRDSENNSRNLVYILLAGFVAILFIFLGHRKSKELAKLRRQKQRLEEERKELTRKNKKLSIRLKRLKGDPYLIKRIARDRLGLVLPGEKKLKIEEPLPRREPLSDSPPIETEPASPDSPVIFMD